MTHPRDDDRLVRRHRRRRSADDRASTTSAAPPTRRGCGSCVDDLASPEAGLTPLGNGFHRREVKSALVGRLLTQLRFGEHPEHADVPVERPIFVVGLPRTGTTALHRLLQRRPATPGARAVADGVPAAAAAARDLGRRPDLLRDAGGVLGAPHREPGVHGHPLHGCDVGRGVLAAAAADRQVDQLRVAGATCRATRPGWPSRTGPTPTSGTSANLQLIGLNDPRSGGC